MKKRTRTIASVAVVAAVAGGGVWALQTNAFGTQSAPEAEAAATTVPVSTAAVTRGDLTESKDYKAAVAYAEKWDLTTGAEGTITKAHPAGTTVKPGQVVIWVNAKPVYLAQGAVPMYRTLERINTSEKDPNGKNKQLLSGDDVKQLQQFLKQQGFDLDGKLEIDGIFGTATEKAVKAWQKSIGQPQDGKVTNALVVFNDGPLRLAEGYRVGAKYEKIEVTGSQPTVTVDVSAQERSALAVGTKVTVTFGDSEPVAANVVDQTEVQGEDSSSTSWRSTLAIEGAIPDGATAATVTVSTTAAANQLLVPVGALVALAEGGYAVETVSGSTRQYVRVELGAVLDGQAAITGAVTEGTQVVIPS